KDCGYFARHAHMAPQVGPVRDRLIVDFDDAVGNTARERRADLAFELDDAGVVTADAEIAGAGQHAVTLHAVDDFLPQPHLGRDHTRTAIRRTADHCLAAVTAGIDFRPDVVTAVNRRDAFHSRGAGAVEQLPEHLDALTFGGLHGDEPLERAGGVVQVLDQ